MAVDHHIMVCAWFFMKQLSNIFSYLLLLFQRRCLNMFSVGCLIDVAIQAEGDKRSWT